MARWLKIAARVSENEIPQGRPADWLSQDIGEYSVHGVFVLSTCLHVPVFSMGQVTSGDWSLGYYFNVI